MTLFAIGSEKSSYAISITWLSLGLIEKGSQLITRKPLFWHWNITSMAVKLDKWVQEKKKKNTCTPLIDMLATYKVTSPVFRATKDFRSIILLGKRYCNPEKIRHRYYQCVSVVGIIILSKLFYFWYFHTPLTSFRLLELWLDGCWMVICHQLSDPIDHLGRTKILFPLQWDYFCNIPTRMTFTISTPYRLYQTIHSHLINRRDERSW